MARTLFHEEQRFRQPWLIGIVGAASVAEMLVFGWGAYKQLVKGEPWGDRPMSDTALAATATINIVMMAGILALLYASRLVTEVREDGLYVQFFPFHLSPRRIEPEKIESHSAVTYRPLPDYGGWGIRYGRKGKAYNVSGDRGVDLAFRGGGHLLIGSQRPDELNAALSSITHAVR